MCSSSSTSLQTWLGLGSELGSGLGLEFGLGLEQEFGLGVG